MEGDDHGEKQDSDIGSNHNNNMNVDYNKNDDKKSLEALQEQSAIDQPSTSSTKITDYRKMETNNTLGKLTKRTKTIISKLAATRQELLQHKIQVENNKDASKENDMKVFKLLQTMSKKPEIQFPGEALSNKVTNPNGVISNAHSVRPLNQHTKKQLENLVEGLQELVCKLTLNNKNLQSKAEHLARNISSLRNFPIFSNTIANEPSTSASGRQRLNFDTKKIKDSKGKEPRIVKEKQPPAKMFAEYINAMLKKYLGEQEQDKLKKYECLASHIEDLESYAITLVEAGFGCIVETEIVINHKNNRQSFLRMSGDRETTERDGMILLPVARRYAFEGDIVRGFVLNPVNNNSSTAEDSLASKKARKISSHITNGNNSFSLAEDEELNGDIEIDSSPETDIEEITDVLEETMNIVTDNYREAFVIKIVKQTELREVVGSISFMNAVTLNSKSYYILKPHDMKVPTVYIPQDLCMEELKNINKEDICGMLYVVRVLETNSNGHCIGELVQPVGKVGNLEAEIKAILLHNGLKDLQPYEQKFLEMYEGPSPPPSKEDLKIREDMRKKCVFTIDPLTAKDLDDALSVEKLNDKEYEIGVHISDVSHYLQENSELDNLVKFRATSIYLVTEVIHMLPTSLCFKCSLLPGEDKFAFSVFWKWHTEKEELGAPRFTRTIVNSCCQFAYEHAQKIIDNPTDDFDGNDFPEILNGWTSDDIRWRVLLLHQISQKLGAQRYENGALSINNPKLRFQLDPKTGEPITYELESRKEANLLIEEYMLRANQSVAKFIHDHFPNTSILRNHSPPLQKHMKALKERLNNMGMEFDISTSKSVYESMQRLTREASDPKAMNACLSTLLTKPMARARYYCSEGKSSEADFSHYALSIPIYTHFTSPIRRYPDILVHRLLAAALNYCPPPKRTTDELHDLAKICNEQKFKAKKAGDESIELFFIRYVKAKKSIVLKAVVTEILKHMLNVVTLETGHTIPITYKLQRVPVDTSNVPSSICIMEKNSPLKLQLFSTVDIKLFIRKDKLCGSFALKSDKLANNNFYQSNSISEQEDDKTPTTSSRSKGKAKIPNLNQKKNIRTYALSNDE